MIGCGQSTAHDAEQPQRMSLANGRWRRCGKADSTLRSSRAVPHPSTNRALRRLTSEVGRDPVHSTRYGRQRQRRPRAAGKDW